MKLRPLHDHVMVQRVEEDNSKVGSLFVPDSAQEKPQKAKVIAIGGGGLLPNGTRAAMDVAVGDIILFGKYGGSEAKIDGEDYLILRESEILAVVA
jgi:chaperonin GroES